MIPEYQRCVDAGNRSVSFALRFLVVVGVGTVIGIGLSALFADAVADALFKTFGIGEFHAGFSVLGTVFPLVVIPLLFFGFALAFSAKLKQFSISRLISENEE